MSVAGVKALVFDVFGTVVDWRTGIAREAGAFLDRIGRRDVDRFALADAWRAAYSPALEEIRSGRRPFAPLDILHRENLEATLARFGIDAAPVAEAVLDDFNNAWERLDPWPDAVEGLARLKRRYIIAPLSNGNLSLLTNMAKHAGLPWDTILGAEISRAYKPSPESYLRNAEALRLDPSQICLVAAHNYDLKAASALGFRTGFVPRPTEHGPGQTRDLAPTGEWDAVAADFVELARKFDS